MYIRGPHVCVCACECLRHAHTNAWLHTIRTIYISIHLLDVWTIRCACVLASAYGRARHIQWKFCIGVTLHRLWFTTKPNSRHLALALRCACVEAPVMVCVCVDCGRSRCRWAYVLGARTNCENTQSQIYRPRPTHSVTSIWILFINIVVVVACSTLWLTQFLFDSLPLRLHLTLTTSTGDDACERFECAAMTKIAEPKHTSAVQCRSFVAIIQAGNTQHSHIPAPTRHGPNKHIRLFAYTKFPFLKLLNFGSHAVVGRQQQQQHNLNILELIQCNGNNGRTSDWLIGASTDCCCCFSSVWPYMYSSRTWWQTGTTKEYARIVGQRFFKWENARKV